MTSVFLSSFLDFAFVELEYNSILIRVLLDARRNQHQSKHIHSAKLESGEIKYTSEERTPIAKDTLDAVVKLTTWG